jgi:hypothetical protein
MADIVNFRRAAKEKARAQREREAAANRRSFGRSKAEKAADRDAEARASRALDGKQLVPERPKDR